MPKTVFAPGSVVTSAFLNSINNPVFVDTPDADGEIARITNNDLSNASGQIKQEWTTFRDALRVSAGTGLSVTFTGGVVTRPAGEYVTISPGTLTGLANNTTNFIFVNASGVVASSTIYPVIGLILASVDTSGGSVISVSDRRPRHSVMPIASAIRVFGGTSTQDKTCVDGEILDQSPYYFRNFTVPAGVTITIPYSGYFYCSGTVSIAGTIIVQQMGLAPERSIVQLTGSGAFVDGIPSTGLGSRGLAYPWGAQPFGTGGKQGAVTSFSASGFFGWFGLPGDGGGNIWIESAGIVSVTGSIIARGLDGQSGSIGVFTPGAIQGGLFGSVVGAGGGSGGLIYLASLSAISIAGSATFDVRGGNGGNAIASTNGVNHCALGGMGGGGGYVVCVAPSVPNGGASILLNGGTWGTPAGLGFTTVGSLVNLVQANMVTGNALGGAYAGASGRNFFNTSTQVQREAGGNGSFIVRNFVPNA